MGISEKAIRKQIRLDWEVCVKSVAKVLAEMREKEEDETKRHALDFSVKTIDYFLLQSYAENNENADELLKKEGVAEVSRRLKGKEQMLFVPPPPTWWK